MNAHDDPAWQSEDFRKQKARWFRDAVRWLSCEVPSLLPLADYLVGRSDGEISEWLRLNPFHSVANLYIRDFALNEWKTAPSAALRVEANDRDRLNNQRFRELLLAMFPHIYANYLDDSQYEVENDDERPRISKTYLIARALEEIKDPDPDPENELWLLVSEAEYIPTNMPSVDTLAGEFHWFRGMNWRQMVGED